MDISSTAAFFLVMIMLAAMPSASVALVVARSATHGVAHGLAVAAGIVLGDLLFITLALLGMSMLAEMLGGLFAVLRYAAAAYLIWLGIALLRSSIATRPPPSPEGSAASLSASAVSGLLLTLGDLKAILFYASLFPNLFDMTALGATDAGLIVTVTFVTVGGVKVIYALAARRVMGRLRNASCHRYARATAGGVLTATGAYLVTKA